MFPLLISTIPFYLCGNRTPSGETCRLRELPLKKIEKQLHQNWTSTHFTLSPNLFLLPLVSLNASSPPPPPHPGGEDSWPHRSLCRGTHAAGVVGAVRWCDGRAFQYATRRRRPRPRSSVLHSEKSTGVVRASLEENVLEPDIGNLSIFQYTSAAGGAQRSLQH